MVLVKLLHDRAEVPEMGRLRACCPSRDGAVRTGVSVVVPLGMRGVVRSCLVADPCVVRSGEEIVLTTDAEVAEGEHVGDLLFAPTEIVIESGSCEMGPLA